MLRAEDGAQPVSAVRLSSVDGQVRISQGGQVLADPALANTPLFEGTQVLTSDDGRAELEFDDGSIARLAPNSSLTLAVLRGQSGSGDAEIVLQSGLGYFELQGESAASHIRVRFGNSVVTASGFTVLRIDTDNPPGEVAVFSGNAHLERGTAMELDLHGGQSVTLNGADSSGYKLAESIEPDSWDTWNSDRDQALTDEAAARTGATDSIENNNPAWNDLDTSGNWYNVPGEGSIWSPYQAASQNWDPYGYGSWMWTPGFGYIWVSGYSWGYMPFACGNWNYFDDFGWGWAPGGCRPWWGGGAWASNIGHAPPRYRFPRQPHPGWPHGSGGQPQRAGLAAASHAMVAVNRNPRDGTEGLVSRDRNAPVTIGGHLVQPLRSASLRPQYNHPGSGFVNGSRSTYTKTGTQGAGIQGGKSFATESHPSSGGGQHSLSSGHSWSGGGSVGGSMHSGGGGGGGGRGGGGGHR
jgi:hypothetical protein